MTFHGCCHVTHEDVVSQATKTIFFDHLKLESCFFYVIVAWISLIMKHNELKPVASLFIYPGDSLNK
jgi:hypothetical protein